MLLKSALAGRARSVGAPAGAALRSPVEDGLRADLERASAGLAARDAEIERLLAACDAAEAAAESRGRAAGREEAEDRAAEALKALEKGVAAALDRLATDLAGLERLAPALACEAVERVLGGAAPQRELVVHALEQQLRGIDREALLCVHVAGADFADPEALHGLAAASGVRVEVSADLKPGQCRMRLRLGTLEVGPAQQWAPLRETLLAASEPAAR